MIEPRVLKGFRDFLPSEERTRSKVSTRLAHMFESFGFHPIDTPILEYADVLLGKGGGETDKQIYRFADNGGRDVAMRFDLTVPFARYLATHYHEIALPFRRYHIGKVYRGENTQRGRYREFVQCDFDIVGSDAVSVDFEIIHVIIESFAGLAAPPVEVRVSHRGLFDRLLAAVGAGTVDTASVMRAVDKLPKIGTERVSELLSQHLSSEAVADVLAYIQPERSDEASVAKMEELSGGPSAESRRLREVMDQASGLALGEHLRIDSSITRGLDYYTGVVFETFLRDLPDIGSVCSGGRYDNLAELYSKHRVPGVGASIGLDRLLAGLAELGALPKDTGSADVLLLCVDEALANEYHVLARRLRENGLRVDVFPEKKKLGQQFAYAEKNGIRTALIRGPQEVDAGTFTIRDLRSRKSEEGLSFDEAVRRVKDLASAADSPH